MGMLFVLLVIASATFVYWLRRRYSYWDDWNIPVAGSFPMGILGGIGTKYHISELLTKQYHNMRGKATIGGLFMFVNPVALILDLEMVKNVLVRDFNSFHDHGIYSNEEDDPLSAHLFALEGEKWKNMRTKLTPAFTSGKMKMMFPIILKVGQHLKELMDQSVQGIQEFEMRDIVARFTTDAIVTSGFGLDCSSLKDPNIKIRTMGKRIFDQNPHGLLKIMFMTQFRKFSKRMGMKVQDDEMSDFFIGTVRDTVEYREKNNVIRNDVVNLLINIKNTGNVDDNSKGNAQNLTMNELAAQAFLFFVGGFETSSTTLSYTLYELAMNMDVQEKARECVQSVYKECDGELTYESLQTMTYLDQCINESLRKYPPVPVLIRDVKNDYPIPGTDKYLEKGLKAFISVYGIHHDPLYYPNPEVFDPDRFTAEETAKREKFTYFPFGAGPRVCLGIRFAMMEMRVCLAVLLKSYRFTPCSKSTIPLTFSKNNQILVPANGLWLNVEKLE